MNGGWLQISCANRRSNGWNLSAESRIPTNWLRFHRLPFGIEGCARLHRPPFSKGNLPLHSPWLKRCPGTHPASESRAELPPSRKASCKVYQKARTRYLSIRCCRRPFLRLASVSDPLAISVVGLAIGASKEKTRNIHIQERTPGNAQDLSGFGYGFRDLFVGHFLDMVDMVFG